MTHHFLPFVRCGLASRIGVIETFDASLRARVSLPVRLRVNDIDGRDIAKTLTIAGPGDVIGIDPSEIMRTEPRHQVPDHPPNLFAAVEFARPDLPWLFTPAAPDGQRLRPWIVLAVVKKRAASIRMIPGRPLATLICPVSELPDLTESWLWAHAVFMGELGTRRVAEAIAAQPTQSVSRLLCPRRLEPSTGGPESGYYACIVPAFDVGRRAGLGEELAEADLLTLAPAWSSGVVELPVYYQWEFDTGPDGDFEESVDRLQLQPGARLAPVLMDASRPDSRIADAGPLTLPVASALRTVASTDPPLPPTFAPLQAQLRSILQVPQGTGDRVNAPIYGKWQAGGHGTQASATWSPGSGPRWLDELNVDPRYRVAAALGAQVVQQQQEQLVASAWQQAGEVEAVNALLRRKQLAREVSQSIFDKRIARLSSSTVAQVASPAVAVPSAGSSQPSRAVDLTTDALRQALVSPAFRRLSRPLGPRIAAPAAPPSSLRIVADLTAGLLPAIPAAPKAVGTLLTKVLAGAPITDAAPSIAPKLGSIGASGKLMAIGTAPAAPVTPPPATTPMRPYDTFKDDVERQVTIPEGASATTRTDPLSPVFVTPTFDRPMYEPLADLSAQMLLPGLEQLPDNSVVLLKVNPAFVEAYMVGLNDEMSRELLWREYPTTLRGTYFRQFWDTGTGLPHDATPAMRESLRDIPPIAEWREGLGEHMSAARGSGLFLMLFKGDLLLRFPTALVYAARAKWPDAATTPDVPIAGDQFVFPTLHLAPAPGVMMLGFNLVGPTGQVVSEDTIAGAPTRAGDPGWFFVIEEHPTQPRFGLDLSRGRLTSWRELSWSDVGTRPDGYIQVERRVPTLESPHPAAPADRDRSEPVWNRSAADMACITMQLPYRLEIHSSFWFRPGNLP